MLSTHHPMGKHKGYAPSMIARLQRQKKFLEGNSLAAQAHRLFGKQLDTMQIAERMKKPEAEVVRLLDEARNKMLGIEKAA